jgi:tetratricopeptide (TPR) repeat protein
MNKNQYIGIIILTIYIALISHISYGSTPKLHVDVGLNHFYKNRYLEAYREFKAALDLDPSYPEAHYNLGRVYKLQGFLKEALVEFQLAVQLKPDYLAAKRELEALKSTLEADIDAQLRLQGKDTVNRQEFQQIPSSELGAKARELLNQGKTEEAIKHYELLSKENPKDLNVHKMLGFLYYRQNKYSESLNSYNRVLAITPNDAEINYSIGLIYMKTGDLRRAEGYFNQAVKQYPDMLKACFALGETYEAQGRIDDAVFQFRKCSELNPNLPEVQNKLSFLAGKQGYSYFSRGSYYYQKGDYENAQSMLSVARNYASLTPEQNRQAEEMIKTSQYWIDKKRAEQREIAQREQVRTEANISRSFLVTDVSKNVFPYMGKAVEWDGQIEGIVKRRGKTILLVNSDPSVNAESNMDFSFEVEINKELPNDRRIAALSEITVVGKVLRVDKLKNPKSGSFSTRRQPVIEASEVTFMRKGYVQPLVLRF